MAAHIRLRRIGKNPKKRPHFRLSVLEETRSRDGRIIEELGYYNPVSGALKVNKERLDYWVKNGARLSETAGRLVKKIK